MANETPVEGKPFNHFNPPELPQDLPPNMRGPNYLGPINYAPQQNYTRTRMVAFRTADEVNAWFAAHHDQMVCWMGILNDYIVVLAAKVLSDEESKEMDDYADAVRRVQEEVRQRRAEAEAEHQKLAETAEKERAELLEVGRTCLQHHKPLVEENRKLKDQLRKKRKE